MFSSRAEHRLLLREDNADRRLMPLGREVGLVADDAWARFEVKKAAIEAARAWCDATQVRPNAATAKRFVDAGLSVPKKPLTVSELIRRPQLHWRDIEKLVDSAPDLDASTAEQVETDLKYAGYLSREESRAAKTRKMESVRIPEDMDFVFSGISSEVAERLRAARPETLGAAARLPGVTPAAIDIIAVLLARRKVG